MATKEIAGFETLEFGEQPHCLRCGFPKDSRHHEGA